MKRIIYFSCLLITVSLMLLSCLGGGGGDESDSGNTNTDPNTNSTPVADAGTDQNITTGSLVTLDGSSCSDADQDSLTYSWSFISIPSESSASLSDTSIFNPAFTADIDGTYSVSLTVNDGTVNSSADTITVTASTSNSAPVANAGPDQNVSAGNLVTLDGSASSDADQDNLTYSWSFTSTPGSSSATLSDTSAVGPSFTADVDGAYTISLTVNDGTLDSNAETVTVTASTANSAPVANPGPDQSTSTGSLVTLDGSASNDADQDNLTYNWAFTSIPSGSSAAFPSSSVVGPTFTPDKSGSYVISLVVNDGIINSSADSVVITVTDPFVIKNLGVTFGTWDQQNNTAGSFIFTLSEDKVFLEFGAIVTDGQGNPKELPTFEYILDENADVFAIADGQVYSVTWQADTQDYEISVWTNTTPQYEVYYDHVLNPLITAGENITAGDLVGKPGTRGGGLGRFEIMINSGNLGKSYCPFVHFDPALKNQYEQQVTQMMSDWEQFKGNSSLYDEAGHLYPGCRYEEMDM